MGSYWDASGKLVDGRFEQTGRKASLPAAVSYDTVLNLAAAGQISVIITPPVGELWRLKNLYFNIAAPIGASTANHYIIATLSNGVGQNIIFGQSAFGSPIRCMYNTLLDATISKIPSTEGAQQVAILNTVISNAQPLKITYSNDTNVVQTGTLQITITKEVEYIV